MDYGRQKDLEELAEALQNAKSTNEREYYERIMHRILSESDRIRFLREELIKATRINDRRHVQRVINRIQYVRLEESSGHSWGSNRRNRDVN